MRRARQGAVGVVLAVAAMVPAPWASATFPALLRRNQQPPAQTVVYEKNIVLSKGYYRLEEMKVEIALLSDIATFPYYLDARAAGEILELRGYVPNDRVRQRALQLARRTTFLMVNDALRIQTDLSVRPPLRSARVLQQEGAELLQQKLGERAKQLTLGVGANGVSVVTGPIDSVESKLAVSRLFRQLSGCFGVVNDMTVQYILRDGQRVVQVTRDGSLVVAPSALGVAPPQIVASPPAPAMPIPVIAASTIAAPKLAAPVPYILMPVLVPATPRLAKKPSAPGVPRPTIPPTPSKNSLDVLKVELRLPTPVMPKPANTPTKPEPIKIGSAADVLTAPKLPLKWSHPAMSWESQVKKLEPINASAIPAAPRVSREEAKMPTPIAPSPPAEMKKPHDAPMESTSRKANKKSSPPFAEARGAPTFAMTWRRPGGEEASEPKAPTMTNPADVLASTPVMPKPVLTPAAASLSSSRRWPPAYQPQSTGHPGVILFDDPSPSKAAPAAIGTSPPVVPANLQRQVKSICGRKAREVAVQTQPDGTVLVNVKVNSSVEDQLTRKILSIPEMTYPQVRLRMDVEP